MNIKELEKWLICKHCSSINIRIKAFCPGDKYLDHSFAICVCNTCGLEDLTHYDTFMDRLRQFKESFKYIFRGLVQTELEWVLIIKEVKKMASQKKMMEEATKRIANLEQELAEK